LEIIGTMAGFVIAFILFWLRDIHLFKKRQKDKIKREIIRNRLEKLYTPLYLLLKSSEWLTGKKTIGTSKSSREEGEGRQKEHLDKIIENNLYLASDELHKFLPKIYGAGYYKPQNQEDFNKLMELIEKDYEELRKSYLTEDR
jgi:hypothetical protein